MFLLFSFPLLLNTNGLKETKSITESFNSTHTGISNLTKAIIYTDSVYMINSKSNFFDTLLYVNTVSDFVKERFYHGLSNYSIADNWIAFIIGKFVWSHVSAIVIPNDLLKHNEGLCSQQTIVFLALLKQKGISFRSVGLGYSKGPGHFLSEVRYQGDWHLYDVTMEPEWEKVKSKHMSMAYYQYYPDSLYLAYQYRLEKTLFDKIMERVEFGKINEMPAKNMQLFHQITKLLTYVVPVIFLLLFFWFYKKRLKSNT